MVESNGYFPITIRIPQNGFKILVCEGCHDILRVPYRCKGRFCTTCSCGETKERSRLLLEDVFQVNHRHVVFTIDEGLWSVFLLAAWKG
ncbi:transposase zinc-binding domain-containing protein [Paenibacillus sp. N3.4]|uniref:transposase zinc-binding domain-containing protein n=1 Tax=Paenibacillus sp. N3.4 TaxID=2603222 RepID=UPI0021C346E5|nr:transposase zinc-binding domain-containing protein [Paenibacillus sp. N3.4]